MLLRVEIEGDVLNDSIKGLKTAVAVSSPWHL